MVWRRKIAVSSNFILHKSLSPAQINKRCFSQETLENNNRNNKKFKKKWHFFLYNKLFLNTKLPVHSHMWNSWNVTSRDNLLILRWSSHLVFDLHILWEASEEGDGHIFNALMFLSPSTHDCIISNLSSSERCLKNVI